jgi:hypothetical protein
LLSKHGIKIEDDNVTDAENAAPKAENPVHAPKLGTSDPENGAKISSSGRRVQHFWKYVLV